MAARAAAHAPLSQPAWRQACAGQAPLQRPHKHVAWASSTAQLRGKRLGAAQARPQQQRMLATHNVPRRQTLVTTVVLGSATKDASSTTSDWPTCSIERADTRKYGKTSFKVDFLPPSGNVGYKGVVIFMHGFEQVPQFMSLQDYATVLERIAADGMWVVAPVQPQFIPEDPVLKALGANRETLQDVVHADAQQIANLLFTKGKGGKPALNEAAKKANIDIGSIDGKQIGISGHSLGGGLTWSIVQDFPGRFDKLAVMAPYPSMVIPSLSPENVIGAEGFKPPGESLILEGGLDILAPARSINTEIFDPLVALGPKPAVTKFEFHFGTHTGYQDVTGIGTVLRFPAGVLVTIPEDRAGQLSAYTGSDAAPRVELITGALTNTKVFTLPRPVEDFVLAATKINSYAIYVILLALLLGISSVYYYTPFVQRPQTTVRWRHVSEWTAHAMVKHR